MIEILKVSKTYTSTVGTKQVLKDISFAVRTGERVCLVGPNGSGKTTLLRLVLGIEKPDSGVVEVVNRDANLTPSYVPQDYRNALFPWLRLERNLHLSNDSVSGTARSTYNREFRALCDGFHIQFDFVRYPYQLSGGEQQIFVLARALLSPSGFLVLDEPLSAVDYGRRRLIQEDLGQRFHRQCATVILATHDFEEAALLGDRVIVLDPESGGIRAVVPIGIPWPRTPDMRQSQELQTAVAAITKSVL